MVSAPAEGDLVEASADGDSKRERSRLGCADVPGFKVGSMGDAPKRREATMEGERKDSIEIRPWKTEWRHEETGEQRRVALNVRDGLR